MVKYPAIFLVMLLLIGAVPTIDSGKLGQTEPYEAHGRSTGVDVTVTSINFSYTTPSDAEKYQMFSSNFPIPGFDRPNILYVTDAVVDVPIQVDITVENLGTAPSGNIDIHILILHNEYSQFELENRTLMLASLNGGNSNTISDVFTPTYSGNHTLIISATPTISDDNPQNNQVNGAFTVANWYFNCDNLAGWTAGSEWGLSSDTGLSFGSSCHVGNGQFSSYSNNAATGLITPVMDMSDAVENPQRTNGLSFFYTGSTQSNDVLKIQVKTAFGGWHDLQSLSGTIDADFIDGQSYQTFTVNHAGAISPLIPVPQEHYHAQTQFRFFFESDSSNTDIGFYLDEMVFVYDQKVRAEEFALSTTGISTSGSIAGEWGNIRVELTNDGNISDFFIPSVTGLPSNWNVYYTNMNGVSIHQDTGILLSPGQTKSIDINIQPDVNASVGFEQMTFTATSSQHSTVNSSLPMQFQVVPDRVPFIVKPESPPSCPPGNSCPFTVEVQNIGSATDVFELMIDSSALPSGWDVNFAWTQESKTIVRPDTPAYIDFMMTVPLDALPDSKYSFSLSASSENMSSRTHTQNIDISASMISDAAVDVQPMERSKNWLISAGETVSVEFTIWNNASRQDIFAISLETSDIGQWIVDGVPEIHAVINSQSTSTFKIDVTAPSTAQAGDRGPDLSPRITSIRSGMVFNSNVFDELIVETVSDLELRVVSKPSKLFPGVPCLVELEIENNGNGPVQADVSSITLPDSWTWWISTNNVNTTGPFSLSAPYDAQDIIDIDIWIVLPSSERSGEVHSLSFSVSNSEGYEDVNPVDNRIEFDTVTGSVRIPQILANMNETSASVGGTKSVNVTVKNIGNAADDLYNVMASVSVSPPSDDLIAFMSVGNSGTSIELGVDHIFNMEAGQEMPVFVDVLIPESVPINTRIVITFEVRAGVDEELRPYQLSHDILILVDEKRAMEVQFEGGENQTFVTGNAVPLWINMTSTSSVSETLLLTLEKPKEWQTVCQGILTNATAQEIQFSVGHITEQNNDIFCELHRLGGELSGTVNVKVESLDGELAWTEKRDVSFSQTPSDEFSMNVELIASSFALVLLLSILLTLLVIKRKRRSADYFVENNTQDTVIAHQESVSGPPISATPVHIHEPASSVISQEISLQNPPELPASGLPPGWTLEQWNYYGHQYLQSKK